MASTDSLLLLRNALSSATAPFLTTSSEPESAEALKVDSLATATHIYLPSSKPPQCLDLRTTTRFESRTPEPPTMVDIRSVYLAWTMKEVTAPEYLAGAEELSKELESMGQKPVRNLVFVERIELIAWLEGASESEFIKPLDDADMLADANRAADVASGVAGVAQGVPSSGAAGAVPGRPVKVIDPRLQEIYNGERKMGDRNTVLRGIKPTDFSHVRKQAEVFLPKKSKQPSGRPGQPAKPSSQLPSRTAPAPVKAPAGAISSKRQDPIILLSPSASSLLRLSNIKSFLDQGLFVPPDHPDLSSQTTANLLHTTRLLPSLDTRTEKRPFRFIIVDSPEHFKPDYWNRVAAVFTTGQVWQFRGYKWREPQELFGHVLGIYVGERGGPVPAEVKGWGSGVKSFFVDRWDERGHGAGVDQNLREGRRWRDREVVEEVWRTIEAYMRTKPEWRR